MIYMSGMWVSLDDPNQLSGSVVADYTSKMQLLGRLISTRFAKFLSEIV